LPAGQVRNHCNAKNLKNLTWNLSSTRLHNSTENEDITFRYSFVHDLDNSNFEDWTTLQYAWISGYRRVSHPYNKPTATFLVIFPQNGGTILG